MNRACLVDLTKCIGCRGCQVACKQWNELPAERTQFFAGNGGYQNPPRLSSNTYTLVGYTEFRSDDDIKWIFSKRQCMHCLEPSCKSACPVDAFHITEEGAVIYDGNKCMGCRYCMMACPFGIPTFEWDKTIPYIKKCTYCMDRIAGDVPDTNLNGQAMTPDQIQRHTAGYNKPACAKTCPTGGIKFGNREELIAEARARINSSPNAYINHIYGEQEAGGTNWLYLSAVPFESVGFPSSEKIGYKPYSTYTDAAMKSVPAIVAGGGAILGGVYWLWQRRNELAETGLSGEQTGGSTGGSNE